MAAKPDYPRLVADERAAFGGLLRSLSGEQWAGPSLCQGWSVRDVACHVASTNAARLGRTALGLAAAGLSLHRFTMREMDRWRARSEAEIAAAVARPEIDGLLRLMPAGALTEVFLHQQDVRRPLGVPHPHLEEALVAVLDASTRASTGTGSHRRMRGLRLRAVDAGWTHGEGPEVAGPAETLIMAVNGRPVRTEELSGDGVAVLTARIRPPDLPAAGSAAGGAG